MKRNHCGGRMSERVGTGLYVWSITLYYALC